MHAFVSGLIAGYGIAIPVGAIAVLIVTKAARENFRSAATAGLGAATADLTYAVVAVAAGAALAPYDKELPLLKTGQLPEITDEQMNERLTGTREYTLVILKATPVTFQDESRPIIWEHSRRNMALHDAGGLPLICPVTDGSDVAGIAIFAVPPEEVRGIVDRDPAVQAGVLTYELHPVRGFPGDSLP